MPKSFASIFALAAMTCFLFFATSCRDTSTRVAPPEQDPVARQIDLLNRAAYPEGSYTVQKGDTPRAIASKLGVDYPVFASTNGISENTPLTPGSVLVVPKVSERTDSFAVPPGAVQGVVPQPVKISSAMAGAPPSNAAPAVAAAKQPIARPAPAAASISWTSTTGAPTTPDGTMSAISTGRVTEVHRGYPSLGDVVIIENQDKTERAVYAGSFTPIVAKGQAVNAGQQIGTNARPGGVKVTRFMTGPR
jgi:murein DD-endopeptidase MepM/ murein hydrolase activator NlpD